MGIRAQMSLAENQLKEIDRQLQYGFSYTYGQRRLRILARLSVLYVIANNEPHRLTVEHRSKF
jgi:hypothetical protein